MTYMQIIDEPLLVLKEFDGAAFDVGKNPHLAALYMFTHIYEKYGIGPVQDHLPAGYRKGAIAEVRIVEMVEGLETGFRQWLYLYQDSSVRRTKLSMEYIISIPGAFPHERPDELVWNPIVSLVSDTSVVLTISKCAISLSGGSIDVPIMKAELLLADHILKEIDRLKQSSLI